MTDAERPAPAHIASTRAGDADREAVAERLRVAAGEGRIEPWELEERLGQAYGARTYGELAALVADLPGQPPFALFPGLPAEPDTLVLRTTTPNIRQAGRWTVPRRITAESTTGWITIDFTQASCAYREVTVAVMTRTGWIQLILPDGWAARVGPLSTYTGHISNKAAETADPGAPTVIVTGHPLFGYIKIRQRRRRR
ncbi:MAG TPA: DUF1707 domain-containing protein [Streptosporangiaceae bacterium]|nr:DUF1707 domain-containing protein [Streptosporangiaceae bacterium]